MSKEKDIGFNYSIYHNIDLFSNNTPCNKNGIIKDDISDPLISDKQMGTFINYNVNCIKIFAIFMSAIILGVVIYITIIKLS
jgi:hypothetical protein